jgi:hypothetical protein
MLRGTVDIPLVDPGIPGTTLPVVEAMVNGRGPFRLAIETGAGFIALSPGVAERMGLKSTGRTADMPAFEADSISLGSASFHGVKLAELPRGPTGVDGLLGLPFFHDVLLTIDYGARRLRVSRDSLPAANGEDILQLTRTGPFWGIPADFAGQHLVGVLDTRGTGRTSVIPDVAKTLRFTGPLEVVGRAGGAAIPETEVKGGTLDGDMRIGRYVFPKPFLTVRPLPAGFPTGPIIGDVVLRNFVVTLDQQHARLRLAKTGSTTIDLGTPARTTTTAPAPVPAQTGLAQYLGRFGERTFAINDGTLHIKRADGPWLEMRQTGPDAFELVAVEGAKIEFVRDSLGAITAVKVLRGGVWETSQRSP